MTRGQELVHGERQAEYGPPEDSFTNIAKVWSAILHIDVSKEHGLKVVREANLHKGDKMFHAIQEEL